MAGSGVPPWLGRLEWGAALGGTAVLVVLHATLADFSGPLWRDEADSVGIATLPTLGGIWSALQYDSFPVLWFLVLRGWIGSGLGTIGGLRLFGFLVGAGVLLALWRNARRLAGEPPLVSIALLGFNAAVLYYGDSIRAYGLGLLLGLLAFGWTWDVVRAPSRRWIVLAGAVSLAAAHLLFHNAVVVFACCAGGLAVLLARGERRWAWAPVGIVALTAISLIPYMGVIRGASEWNMLVSTPATLDWIWGRFRFATESSGSVIPWVWVATALGALAAAFGGRFVVSRHAVGAHTAEQDLRLFCGVTLVSCLVGYVLFLKGLSYYTQPWYYLTLMALVASCAEALFAQVASRPRARIARLAGAVILMALAALPVARAARIRRTNVDLVAARVAGSATSDDLVVVAPWYYGVAFQRYYGGKAPWITVPPVAEFVFHRYDQVKSAMMAPDAMRPVVGRIEETFARGGRVWWIGDLEVPPEGSAPEPPPPRGGTDWGWLDLPYYAAWSRQAGTYLRDHATGGLIAVPVEGDINPSENVALYFLKKGSPGSGGS